MKPIKLNKRSLHWRLVSYYHATMFGQIDEYEGDICGYLTMVGKGLLVVLLIICLASIAVFFVVDLFSWIYVSITIHLLMPNWPTIVVLALAAMFGSIYGIEKTRDWLEVRRRRKLEAAHEFIDPYAYEKPKPDGFVKHAFRSLHDKVCFTVKVE